MAGRVSKYQANNDANAPRTRKSAFYGKPWWRFSHKCLGTNNAPGGLPSGTAGHYLSAMADENEDPRAPYKVYEGDELKGKYATRAEARRRQQQLQSEHPNRHFSMKDRDGKVAM